MTTTVRDIMHEQVTTVHPETKLLDAVGILACQPTGEAPVVATDGTLVGVISEEALIDVVFNATAKTAPVSQYLNSEFFGVMPDASLSRAAKLFALLAVRWLPVVEDGKLVGILTCRDLLKHSLSANELLSEPLLELFPELTADL